MTREYKKWKNRSTNKNEQLLKIQHYIKVRLLHDRQEIRSKSERRRRGDKGRQTTRCQVNRGQNNLFYGFY